MDSALAGTPPVNFAAPKNPVAWNGFTSQFENRIVSSISAPDLTLSMPAPQPTVTVTADPVATTTTASVEPEPTATAEALP
jgi:hypothetical protein